MTSQIEVFEMQRKIDEFAKIVAECDMQIAALIDAIDNSQRLTGMLHEEIRDNRLRM